MKRYLEIIVSFLVLLFFRDTFAGEIQYYSDESCQQQAAGSLKQTDIYTTSWHYAGKKISCVKNGQQYFLNESDQDKIHEYLSIFRAKEFTVESAIKKATQEYPTLDNAKLKAKLKENFQTYVELWSRFSVSDVNEYILLNVACFFIHLSITNHLWRTNRIDLAWITNHRLLTIDLPFILVPVATKLVLPMLIKEEKRANTIPLSMVEPIAFFTTRNNLKEVFPYKSHFMHKNLQIGITSTIVLYTGSVISGYPCWLLLPFLYAN